jgi:hypothetical protein
MKAKGNAMTNPARQGITAGEPCQGARSLRRWRGPSRRAVVNGIFVLGALLLAAAPGSAQTPKPAARAAAPAPQAGGAGGAGGNDADIPKVKVERGAGGKKIYRITEDIRIEGKIQKPEAFFFYQKSSINYDWQELKKDFLPRILDSVNGPPF